jgi:polysaccharide biosynthesis protein PslH
MKITLICSEIPYPAVHGGRIDSWRRIKAFAKRGVELQLIFWWYGIEPTAAELAEIQKYAHKLYPIQIRQTFGSRLSRIPDLLVYPLETSSRLIKRQQLLKLRQAVKEFDPDIIFLDGLHGGGIATTLSQELNLPLVTRSHNIEHLYAQRLLKAAISLGDKFRRYLAVFNLERYEKKMLASSSFFYDISADDLKFWQDLGFKKGRLLPPIIEFAEECLISEHNSIGERLKTYDLVFLGGLNAENNIEAVIWFLTEVLPSIQQQLPQTTVLIAGLNPVDRIVQICDRTPLVTLVGNPVSANDIYRSGRVLINPILNGSGVKIKSIEMLQFGVPIVSTTEGVSGLPSAVKQYFKIADRPVTFAAAAIEFLSSANTLPTVDRQLLESHFGAEIINNVITDLESISRL